MKGMVTRIDLENSFSILIIKGHLSEKRTFITWFYLFFYKKCCIVLPYFKLSRVYFVTKLALEYEFRM